LNSLYSSISTQVLVEVRDGTQVFVEVRDELSDASIRKTVGLRHEKGPFFL